MSVVVRMEMPKSCEGCWMPSSRCKWRTLSWYLKDDSTVSYRNSRSPFCPIICSLPEWHGRLVDADEFLKRAIGTKCFDEDDSRMLHGLVGESITIVPAEAQRSET